MHVVLLALSPNAKLGPGRLACSLHHIVALPASSALRSSVHDSWSRMSCRRVSKARAMDRRRCAADSRASPGRLAAPAPARGPGEEEQGALAIAFERLIARGQQ
jgi:hypothetical protein